MKAIRENVNNSSKNRLMTKFGLAAILGAGLALGSVVNVAQADPRGYQGDYHGDYRGDYHGDRGDWFDRGDFRRDHRHHMRIGDRCADHPRACARRHAKRAAMQEYRYSMREIREYRHHHGYPEYRRHHRHYDSGAMLVIPGQVAFRIDLH